MKLRHTVPNRSRPGRNLLAVEPLEDRTCLSTLSLSGHVLTLTGDNTADTISIKDAGNGKVTASIHGAGGTKSINASGVQSIVVHSGNGNDTVNYALTGALKTSRSIALNLGSGHDLVNLDFSKGVSAPTLSVTVKDGTGQDRVSAVFGAITNSNVNVHATQGRAIDLFSARFNGAISGTSKVSLNVQNGTGYNGVDIGFQSDIGSAAQVAVNTLGGVDPGTTHVNYQGRLNGRLTISEKAGSGGDYLASQVRLSPGSAGTLKDTLQGGAGDDLLRLQVTDQSGKMKSTVESIDGGGGENIAIRTPKVTVSHVQRVS